MTDFTRIPWTCETCGFPIADGTGCVNIPFDELAAHDAGDRLVWRVQHDRCLPTPEVYAIDVDGLRTLRGILAWSDHLAGKRWFTDSTWGQIIGAAFPAKEVGA